MLAAITFAALTLAQAQPVQMAPLPAPVQVLDTGACLDSPRAVPRVLAPPVDRSMQIVRIDKVQSTETYQTGDVIGFLYTLGDGSTWLGQRTPQYMSGAAAQAINRVLSMAHQPGDNVSAFPPQYSHGVALPKAKQFFRVSITPSVMSAALVQLAPCVAWPAGRPLPDPMQ